LVSPASLPVAKRSNSNFVSSSPSGVGRKPFTPKRDWRTLRVVSPSLPQPESPGQSTGIFEGRRVAFQFGSTRFTS
jgi:hypothetical protein